MLDFVLQENNHQCIKLKSVCLLLLTGGLTIRSEKKYSLSYSNHCSNARNTSSGLSSKVSYIKRCSRRHPLRAYVNNLTICIWEVNIKTYHIVEVDIKTYHIVEVDITTYHSVCIL
jgi:hypothetical protein